MSKGIGVLNEVEAAGHDRCITPIREQHLDVAEILDRDQSFDQHPLAGELS